MICQCATLLVSSETPVPMDEPQTVLGEKEVLTKSLFTSQTQKTQSFLSPNWYPSSLYS